MKSHWKIALFTCMVLMLSPGCKKLEGEFGFKAPFDDVYKKIAGVPEFREGDKREWTFVFREFTGTRDIGVFIMKKELVWVEVTHFMEKVRQEDRVIRGTIEDLREGRYKIAIVHKSDLVAEKEFLVYSDEESQ